MTFEELMQISAEKGEQEGFQLGLQQGLQQGESRILRLTAQMIQQEKLHPFPACRMMRSFQKKCSRSIICNFSPRAIVIYRFYMRKPVNRHFMPIHRRSYLTVKRSFIPTKALFIKAVFGRTLSAFYLSLCFFRFKKNIFLFAWHTLSSPYPDL